MSDAQPVLLDVTPGELAVVTINRPEKKNAFDRETINQLAEMFDLLAKNTDEVRVIMLRGAGDVFCAGGDLKALTEEKRPVTGNRERIRRMHIWFHELVNLEMPVIAAVDGPAFGAGFNLALAADVVLCTPRAQFCSVFGRIGLVPDLGGFFLLPRIVGLQRAKEIVFSSRTINADEALTLGLAYAIHEPDALMKEAHRLADRFALASTDAIGMAKTILNQSFHLDQHALAELEAYAQGVAMDSAYHLDAVQRFLDKKPLQYDWDRLSKADTPG